MYNRACENERWTFEKVMTYDNNNNMKTWRLQLNHSYFSWLSTVQEQFLKSNMRNYNAWSLKKEIKSKTLLLFNNNGIGSAIDYSCSE